MSAPAQVTPFGNAVRTRGGVTPTLDLPSSIYHNGGQFGVQLNGPRNGLGVLFLGVSNRNWGALRLPIDIRAATGGTLAGTLLVSGEILIAAPLTTGTSRLSLPAAFRSTGASLFAQLLTSDPQAPARAIGASSVGWRIVPQPPPTISSQSRNDVVSNLPLTVGGSDLPNTAADICSVIADSNGNVLAFLEPQTSTGRNFSSRVTVAQPNSSGRIMMVPGSGAYADAKTTGKFRHGPTDVRAFTSSSSIQVTSSRTIRTGSSLSCSRYPIRYNAMAGQLEVIVPASLTCQPNTRFFMWFDCAIRGATDGTKRWDYSCRLSNTTVATSTECLAEAGSTLIRVFQNRKGILVLPVVTSSGGMVKLSIRPVTGMIRAINGQRCGMVYIGC